MPPAEKLRVWAAMQVAVQQLAEAGIRHCHPAATDREVFLRRVSLSLDAETMRKVFDWNPR